MLLEQFTLKKIIYAVTLGFFSETTA
jgi:hypothetical protein